MPSYTFAVLTDCKRLHISVAEVSNLDRLERMGELGIDAVVRGDARSNS